MNRPAPLLLALFCLQLCLTAQAEYAWKGDLKPSVLPVEGPRKGVPTAGDIASLDGFSFVLGAPGNYKFHRRLENENMLMAEHNEGRPRCIAVKIPPKYRGDLKIWPNPLLLMTSAQKKDLRGISIFDPPPNFNWEKTLAGINWEQCVLCIDLSNESKKLPELPLGLRYLELADTAENHSGLKLNKLTDLRYFQLHSGNRFDLRKIRGNTQLRNLDLDNSSLLHPSALRALINLRFIKLRECDGLEDISFVQDMSLLRVFKVDGTKVQDFRPLNACPELRLLSGTEALIAHLPNPSKVSKLLDVRLLSTPVSKNEAVITKFRQELPKCQVHATWKDAFLAKLGKIDRISVEAGHRTGWGKQKLAFEVKDPVRIEAILQSIDVIEEESGFFCMCSGDPWLHFHRGDKEVAVVGFHHGKSLNWHRGLWPGHASITSDCAEFLITLMNDHGLSGPMRELEHDRREARLDLERAKLQHRIAPAGWIQRLMNALGQNDHDLLPHDPEEEEVQRALNLLQERWPIKEERALNLFTLYGLLPEADWSGLLSFELFLYEHGLATVESEMNRLLATHPDNQQLLQGIARWCFRFTSGSESLKLLKEEQFLRLTQWTLRHPNPFNRVQALCNLTTPRGKPILFQILKAPPAPRAMPDRAHPASEGPWYWSRSLEFKTVAVTEQQAAAILLASERYRPARPLIEKLLKDADEKERSAYQEALKLFDSPKPTNP